MNTREPRTPNFKKQFIPENALDVLRKAGIQGLKVSWMLLKIYIPVSILTAVLDQIGFIDFIAPYLEPLMKLIGLPGEAALVLLAAWVNNLFAAVAAASVIDLSFREITLIAIITGFAHNLILETGILMKLKMGRVGIAFSRLAFGLLAGFLLNLIMPENIRGVVMNPYQVAQEFTWLNFFLKTLTTAGQIIGLMFLVMLFYEIMLLWKYSRKIKEKLTGVTRVFGMTSAALGPWLVAFFIGIAYGAGILFSMNKDHRLTHKDVCLLTVAMCLVHALIEDTIIYVVIGANLWWILGVRFFLLILILFLVSRGEFYRKLTWIGLPKEPAVSD